MCGFVRHHKNEKTLFDSTYFLKACFCVFVASPCVSKLFFVSRVLMFSLFFAKKIKIIENLCKNGVGREKFDVFVRSVWLSQKFLLCMWLTFAYVFQCVVSSSTEK